MLHIPKPIDIVMDSHLGNPRAVCELTCAQLECALYGDSLTDWLSRTSDRANPKYSLAQPYSIYIHGIGNRWLATLLAVPTVYTSHHIFIMSSKQSSNLLLINGPNLNLLGTREPSVYGSQTLDDVHKLAQQTAAGYEVNVMTFQSNHEGAIIDRIHQARDEGVKGILINPGVSLVGRRGCKANDPFSTGALTHTSVGLRDALLGVSIPFIEIHISNPHSRESFRHHSYLSDKALAVIAGLGVTGYGEPPVVLVQGSGTF